VIGPRPTALDASCEALRTSPGHLLDAAAVINERLQGSERAVVLWDEADLAAEPAAAEAIARVVAATPGARAIEMCADVSGPGLRALGIPAAGDLLCALEAGDIDILLTIGTDPTTGPAGGRWAAAADHAGTIIEMATHHTGLTDRAALVLPMLAPLEDEGVLVSMTGRAQRLRPGAREAAGAAAAWEMIVGITHRIGRPVPDRTPAQAFRRLADQHAAFAGLDYRAIGREGAVIAPVPQGPPAAAHDAAGDGLLVVPCTPVFGDAVAHRSDALEAVREPSHVGLAPAEAERLGVRTDARVRVTTPEGTAVLPLQVDSRLHEGALYLVMGDPASGAARLLPVDRAPVRAAVSAATREEVGA